MVIVTSPPRDPGNFFGTHHQGVDEWLQLHKLVGEKDTWDQTMMMENLILFFERTAKAWFNNNVGELTSREVCKTMLRKLFGISAVCKQATKKHFVRMSGHSSTGAYLAYTQDVLTICRKIHTTMTGADKVAHVLKGIANDLYLLVLEGCSSVQDLIKECRCYQGAKGRHIANYFTRLPNTAVTYVGTSVLRPSLIYPILTLRESFGTTLKPCH